MKLEDLLDEDIDPKDYSWHQMRRLCEVYHLRTGGTKDEMAKRLRRARDDAITGLASPSEEEKQQLDSARQQVEQSDAEETAAALEEASATEGKKKQPHVEHQQEIIDLDTTIDRLKQDFAREMKEKFDTLKSAQENSSTTGDDRFIGFYNHKQNLRSWCADGHPDEDRFRKNGWNPVYFADRKEDIVKWVMQQPAVTVATTKPSQDGGDDIPKSGMHREKQADAETPVDHGITKVQPDRARISAASQAKRSWGNALGKLKETARQLGMDTASKDPTCRTLNFDTETDDTSVTNIQQSTFGQKLQGDQKETTDNSTSAYAAANSKYSTLISNDPVQNREQNLISPKPSIENPYSTGRTPLTDKELCQANDFYLGGRYGKDDADELEALYDVLNLPKNWFQNVLYTFVRVIGEEEVPYLNDKEIKNLPRLANLEPETVVDWYDDMESELMMITTISLLPFDAIVINWQYVGLCIPGIGERRYLEMARVLWRICEKTLPRDEDAVRDAFKINSN